MEPVDPSPAALGYRWPAEWEPHAATWLSWPHNPETWPGRLAAVERVFADMVRALHERERVRINLVAAQVPRVRALLAEAGVALDAVDFVDTPTDDAWVRDHGGIGVVRERDGVRERALLDFGFNAWGGKYPPWERDDAVPRHMAEHLGLPRFAIADVLEGGAVDGNGCGSLLTTEACLLNPNRGPGRTREAVERFLGETLGAEQVLWLGDGIAGDDTDGHVDDLARFVAADAIVAAEAPPDHPDHAVLADALARLRGFRDPAGRAFRIATLPAAPAVRDGDAPCPATYVNFYLANGLVLLPTFGAASDARARAILGELLPGRDVVGVPASDLVVGLGAVHCLTQQEPAEAAPQGSQAPLNAR